MQVDMTQQRRLIVARAMVQMALELLELDHEAHDSELWGDDLDDLGDVDASIAGQTDPRIADDISKVLDILHDVVNPDAITLTEDIEGTEFQDWDMRDS
ncbi:MAG TPA: hypothetical protein VFQ26_08140 [Nitrospiraceae bacterium]|nr:hypothetical protein [Nitrospiraceae bacterium]